MMNIDVDASHWRAPLDFYEALLAALHAPDWHGRSVDALIDSIIIGSINDVKPPYRVVVTGLDNASVLAADEVRYTFEMLSAAGANIEITPVSAVLEIIRTETGS